jgi:hypothetical protein
MEISLHIRPGWVAARQTPQDPLFKTRNCGRSDERL